MFSFHQPVEQSTAIDSLVDYLSFFVICVFVLGVLDWLIQDVQLWTF